MKERRQPQLYDPRLFHRHGRPLAVDPQAFFSFFMQPESRDNVELGNVVIVDVCGPLHTYDEGWCDSYESITARVAQACESAAQAIILRIDSPGGDVGGCYDAARKVRALAAAAGKSLYSFVENTASSAAYAFAAAAQVVVLSDSAIVGSIGVISTRNDFSANNQQHGLRVALITSGARKADGNPDMPISDGELKATQQIVDSMAEVFFGLVAELRGIDAAAVQALEAKRFHGQAAVTAGLADRVQSFDALVASISNGELAMASPYDKARAALEEAAKGNDANAEAARRALAAMNPPKDPDSDAEGGDPPADDEEDPKKPKDGDAAAAGDPPADDDDKEAATQAAAAATPMAARSAQDIALEALGKVHKLEAAQARERTDRERLALLDGRPDFAPELRALLMTSPLAKVREFCKDMPKGQSAKPGGARAAATAVVSGTRGETQGQMQATAVGAAEATDMDLCMGLTTQEVGVRVEGTRQVFGFREVPISAAKPAAAGGVK